MKLSTTALVAVLLSTAAVSAAPTQITAEKIDTNSLVKKSDINDVMALIEQLGQNNQKRALIEDEAQLLELATRDQSLLAQLITALLNSGLIGDIWKILTTDQQLKSLVVGMVKSAIKGAIAQGPALIQAVWQSGLLQTIFKDIFQNGELRPLLFSAAKAIFSSGLNLLKAFLAMRNGGSSGTTPAPSTGSGAAAKRELDTDASDNVIRLFDLSQLGDDDFIDKRDMLAVAQQVYTAIKNTGLVQGLVQKALADPQASISLLTNVLKKGWVLGTDVYNWANQSGILQSGLKWLGANGATYASDVAQFLGNQIAQGKASVSDIDNAQPISGGTTTPTAAAAAPAASGYKQRRNY